MCRGKWPEKGLESTKESGSNRNMFFWVHSQVMSSVIVNTEFFFTCSITLTPTRKVSFLNFCSFTNLNPEAQTGNLFSLYKIFEDYIRLFISQHVKTQRHRKLLISVFSLDHLPPLSISFQLLFIALSFGLGFWRCLGLQVWPKIVPAYEMSHKTHEDTAPYHYRNRSPVLGTTFQGAIVS